jgi:phenylacetate-CoA ligase
VLFQNLMASGYGFQQRLLRHGGRYQQYCRELEQSQWWPLEALQDYQNRRLRALVDFCYTQVPYYQDLFDSLQLRPTDIRTLADLAYLPILEKETVRAQPEQFTPRHLRERRIPKSTGGTTGKPLRYYVTPSAVQYSYATYEVRFRNWAGVKFGDRMASINGKPIVPIKTMTPPFWRYNLAFNQLYLSPYHLSDSNLPYYIRRLQQFEPQVIVGYVSTVHAIARFILAHDYIGLIRPKAMLVSSETLFDWIRADIETAFQCKVSNSYGLGELVAFISECEAGSLHISPEYGAVEMVKLDHNLELICTGLFNYAMPLLRYRTGDIVEPASEKTCACGRHLPMVRAILGRVDDQVVTPDGVMVGPAPLSVAFKSVPNLKEAQIYQQTTEKITAHLVVTDAFTPATEQFLLEELRKRLGYSLEIQLVYETSIARTSSGKQRLIISECSNQVSVGIDSILGCNNPA